MVWGSGRNRRSLVLCCIFLQRVFSLFSRKICCKKRTCFILAAGVVIYYSYPGGVQVNNSLTDWLRSASYTLRYIHVVYGAQRRRHVFVVISFLCFGRCFLVACFPCPFSNCSILLFKTKILGVGGRGRLAGQSTCVYTCLGIGVGFFLLYVTCFYIYFSLCIFFKHLFLMFGEFIHPHLPGTLTSTTMGVWFFYYYYFYLVICLNSGFLGKYYFYFLFWLKFFSFHFFLLFTFISVDFFVLLFLSCTYAWKYRFTRSFWVCLGVFNVFPPLFYIMLNIFFSYPWRFCFVPCLYCFALEFLFGLYFLFWFFINFFLK